MARDPIRGQPRQTPPEDGQEADPPRGITCRRCGCNHFYVVETRKISQERIMRRRECRHCGQRLTTYEKEFGR